MKRTRRNLTLLNKKEFIVAALVFLICCGASLYGYVFRPPSLPENPLRVVMPNTGGTVLFPHKHHFDDDGGAFECEDCHHDYDPDEVPPRELHCMACHYNNQDVVETVCVDDPAHPRCIGKKCNECHEGEECSFCHRRNP